MTVIHLLKSKFFYFSTDDTIHFKKTKKEKQLVLPEIKVNIIVNENNQKYKNDSDDSDIENNVINTNTEKKYDDLFKTTDGKTRR